MSRTIAQIFSIATIFLVDANKILCDGPLIETGETAMNELIAIFTLVIEQNVDQPTSEQIAAQVRKARRARKLAK